MRTRYRQEMAGSRVVVDWCCDPIERIDEVDFVSASEQSRELVEIQVTPVPTSDGFHVVGVRLRALSPDSTTDEYRSSEGFSVASIDATISRVSFDLDLARTAQIAKIHEVPLLGAPAAGAGFGGGARLHRMMRVRGLRVGTADHRVVLNGEVFERRYTGFNSSSAQGELLPLDLAFEPLQSALKGVAFSEANSLEPARDLLERQFLDFSVAQDWLRELYLEMAARFGTSSMIPTLLDVSAHAPPRQQVLALNALAAITHWDRRFDAQGRARPVGTVAAEYRSECGPD